MMPGPFAETSLLFSLAEASTRNIPGGPSLEPFIEGLRVINDHESYGPDQRRRALMQCTAAIERIIDPSISLRKSESVVSEAVSHSQDRLSAEYSARPAESSPHREVRIFVDSVNDRLENLQHAFHARSALAVGAAEIAWRCNYRVEPLAIFHLGLEAPLSLRLMTGREVFYMDVNIDSAVVSVEPSRASSAIPLEPNEWLLRVVREHQEAHAHMPDKQAALLQLQAILEPNNVDVHRGLVETYAELGRPDLADMTVARARERGRGFD